LKIFEIIKETVPFENVTRDHGIEFNKSKKALCPCHDDHNPSLSLHPSGEYAHCFTCGITLDLIEFEYLLGKHPNRWEAAKALNSRYNLGLKFDDQSRKQETEFIESNKLIESIVYYEYLYPYPIAQPLVVLSFEMLMHQV